MADGLALTLIRTAVRTFYTTEHMLVIDALAIHGTLQDTDLSHVLGMQTKALRRLCGKLKEDGLIMVQARSERRTDGTTSFYGGGPGVGKERMVQRDWYYLNFHRAIDALKYRMWKLNRHVESLGAPTTEKKDLVCPRCKSEFTHMQVMDSIDPSTGDFLCHRCGHALDEVEEDERANENESMKRLNSQLAKLVNLMREIDATNVPENDFVHALEKSKPILRDQAHPAGKTEVFDEPNRNLASAKGLAIQPEKISVSVQDDEEVKKETAAAEAAARREKEARQNALPEWIAKSTVSGEVTAVGAKEDRLRREREAHAGVSGLKDEEEDKKAVGGEDDVMAAYWKEMAEMKKNEEASARKEEEDEEDEEDDDDEFEDVGIGSSTPAANGNNGAPASTTTSTPGAAVSSNATDDEMPLAKKTKIDSAPASNGTYGAMTLAPPPGPAAEGTPAASDEDEDDDLQFEDV